MILQGFDEKTGEPLRAIEMAKWPHHRHLLDKGFNILHSRRWPRLLYRNTWLTKLFADVLQLCMHGRSHGEHVEALFLSSTA